MITLYWHPKTRAGRIVWLLEEMGLAYQLSDIDIRNPEKAPHMGFALASPMAKIPAISDGDVHISESAAIALYLADRYSENQMAPAIDDVARGRFLYWMFYTPSIMEPAMLERFGLLQSNKVSHGHGDWETCIKTLEAGLAHHDWLMLDQFTAADVMVGSTVHFWDMFNIMPDSQILRDYLARCRLRPAFTRMLEIEEKAA